MVCGDHGIVTVANTWCINLQGQHIVHIILSACYGSQKIVFLLSFVLSLFCRCWALLTEVHFLRKTQFKTTFIFPPSVFIFCSNVCVFLLCMAVVFIA